MDAQEFNLILRRIDNRDEKALEIFYNTYKKKIKFIAFTFISDWHYADDVLIEVTTDIWSNSKKYININKPEGWLYMVVKNASYNFYRKYMQKDKNTLELSQLSKTEMSRLAENDDYSMLYFLSDISKLDETDKEIVSKKIVLKYTHKEISEELGIPLGTVLWRYSNVLKNLKKDYEKIINNIQ